MYSLLELLQDAPLHQGTASVKFELAVQGAPAAYARFGRVLALGANLRVVEVILHVSEELAVLAALHQANERFHPVATQVPPRRGQRTKLKKCGTKTCTSRKNG